MSQLVITNQNQTTSFHVEKRLTSVGDQNIHDIHLPGTKLGLHFSISQEQGNFEILPGNARLRKNGLQVKTKEKLESCDRMEWEGVKAVWIDAPISLREKAQEPLSLRILEDIVRSIQQKGGDFTKGFEKLLEALVKISGAEEGSLLAEDGERGGWRVIGGPKDSLLSHSLLEEALRKRQPIYIQNIVGSPHSEALSIIHSRVFSVACIPLQIGDRVIGALFLHTKTPGKSIEQENLVEIGILATQAALMLVSQAKLDRVDSENRTLTKMLHREESILRSKEDSAMETIIKKLPKIAGAPLNVLIQGETGTGKELVAREIHRLSKNPQAPFIAVNCAAIPATLLESTLFGYEKGAFTGATKSQKGKIEAAEGGTLFLDEIGDLSSELQAKLLRVLQDRIVEPIGASEGRKVEFRLLSATHQDLPKLVEQKLFRQDLYFRLAGTTLTLPALRDRMEDLELLLTHFLERSGTKKSLSADAMEALKAHSWPGNIRELEQVITRAALLSEGEEITAEDLSLSPTLKTENRDERVWDSIPTLDDAQREFSKRLIESTLKKCEGNRAVAAGKLGISERTLYRWIANEPPSANPGSLS